MLSESAPLDLHWPPRKCRKWSRTSIQNNSGYYLCFYAWCVSICFQGQLVLSSHSHSMTETQTLPDNQHVGHTESSKQHKRHQQTWGRTVIQRKFATVRTKSTSTLLTSNCWSHQSSLPRCLLGTRHVLTQCNINTKTTHPATRPQAKHEDERDGQKLRKQIDGKNIFSLWSCKERKKNKIIEAI